MSAMRAYTDRYDELLCVQEGRPDTAAQTEIVIQNRIKITVTRERPVAKYTRSDTINAIQQLDFYLR
jgi:hypothetical protein